MIYTIRKYTHRARPVRIGLYIGGKVITKHVVFTPSCRYYLDPPDNMDINKLFGIGYLWSHHKNSARFGWRYNEITDRIEIFAYCYIRGHRDIVPITAVQIGEQVTFRLTAMRHGEYNFEVTREDENYVYKAVKKPHHGWIGFPLGIYFGGNKTAPDTIKIEMR